MRILSGKFKNKLIKVAKTGVRPTSSLMRRSLFDVIGEDIDGCRFLDLYAGSGIIGLEAISRGASHATFVENDKSAISVIRDNFENLGAGRFVRLMQCDVKYALRILKKKENKFDLVYMDPPYKDDAVSLIYEFDKNNLLCKGGELFLEHSVNNDIDCEKLDLKKLEYVEGRKFGGSVYSRFIF